MIHVSNEKNVWLNLLLPFFYGIPVVTTVHDVLYHPGDEGWRSVPKWCTRLFIRQSDAIIVHSSRLREQAKKHLPVKERCSYVLPHVALTRYRECALRENLSPSAAGYPNVLFFGRLRRYKGIDVLIDAAERVAGELPTVRFTVAGRSDSETAQTLAKASSPLFDVRDRFIPDKEAAQLFIDADLLVLPYIEASQSGVLAIACTFGLPVVASNAGDLGATVAEYKTGLVVPPNDRNLLANAIAQMLQDHEFRRSCASNSRRMAEEIGSGNVSAYATAIYRDVIQAYRNTRTSPLQRMSLFKRKRPSCGA